MERLILASSSPRRKALLQEAGYQFEILEPNQTVECGICTGTGPAALVTELAFKKAADIAPQVGHGTILAADTVAECQGQILGKPANREHAGVMLRLLRGKEHRVYTGVCLWRVPEGEPIVRLDVTTLRMADLSDAELEAYLDSGQWEGKAGAFGYQDQLGWVWVIEGSESNVVGLPMELVAELLAADEA